jgi:LPXTG-motif cell wall-anchored protein
VTESDSGIATLASIECDEDADVTVDLDSATVTVDLAAGDDVTCTFTNVYDVNVLPESPPVAETPPAKTPVVPAAAPATAKAEVLGKTVTRTLPRTGSSSTGTLALVGGALMLLGAALVGGSRRLQTVS